MATTAASGAIGHHLGLRRRALAGLPGGEPHRPAHHARASTPSGRSRRRARSRSRSSARRRARSGSPRTASDRIGRITPGDATGFGPIEEFAYDTTPPKAKVTVIGGGPSAARAGLRAGQEDAPGHPASSAAASLLGEGGAAGVEGRRAVAGRQRLGPLVVARHDEQGPGEEPHRQGGPEREGLARARAPRARRASPCGCFVSDRHATPRSSAPGQGQQQPPPAGGPARGAAGRATAPVDQERTSGAAEEAARVADAAPGRA